MNARITSTYIVQSKESAMRAWIHGIAAAGMIILAGCTSVVPASAPQVTMLNPTTKLEHLRAAEYQAQRVARYDEEARFHESMPLLYQARPRSDVPAMRAHCREVLRHLASARADAASLEQAHRQLSALLN